MSQSTIVLLIMLFMIAMFIWGKYSYGLVTMTCCGLLLITGVCDVQTAFSGLSNKMTILIATMFVIGHAFGKTSFTKMIKAWMQEASKKSGNMLVFCVLLITIAMVQVMVSTPALTIIITFLLALGDKGEVTPTKLMLPMLISVGGWYNVIPIGSGSTRFAVFNALLGLEDEATMLHMADFFKVGIIPAVLLLIYSMLIWKKIPDTDINTEKLQIVKEDEATYTGWQEILVYVLFFGILAVFLASNKFPNLFYIAPVVVVFILIYTGIMSTKDVVALVTSPMIWLVAGVVTVANVMSSSGAGEFIGELILRLLNGVSSGFVICLLFMTVTVVLTTFLYNTGTYLVLTPIAASVALAGNMDPRALAIIVALGSMGSYAFPTGSNQAALIYSVGNYNPVKVAKFTLPAMAIQIVSTAFFANMFFPLY